MPFDCREPGSNVFCLSAPVRGITGEILPNYPSLITLLKPRFAMENVSMSALLIPPMHLWQRKPPGVSYMQGDISRNALISAAHAGVELSPKVWVSVDVDAEKGTVSFQRFHPLVSFHLELRCT